MLTSDTDVRLHGHAGAQAIQPVLVGLEAQPDGDALHDLDVVARGVLRRQDARYRSGTAANSLDVAFEIQAHSVHMRLYRLPWPDVVHLSLFEVGRHPD